MEWLRPATLLSHKIRALDTSPNLHALARGCGLPGVDYRKKDQKVPGPPRLPPVFPGSLTESKGSSARSAELSEFHKPNTDTTTRAGHALD